MTVESTREEDMRVDFGTLLGAVLYRWLRIVVVVVGLVGITYAILLFVPKMYESQSSVLIETRENAFTQPTTQSTQSSSGGSAVTIDAAISSQIELIKSRDTLLKVIDDLKLRDVPEFTASSNPMSGIFALFGRRPSATSVDEIVIENLNQRLTVIRERDSAIISIFVRSLDPQLAADVANAIATTHVSRRAGLALSDTAEASVWLEQEIVKLRERVTEAETKVANFRVENNLFNGPNATPLVDQQLSNVATQITEAQERANTAQSRGALIRQLLDSGQPIGGISDIQSSVVVQQLTQTKATLQGELAQRSATLLPNHPTIRALVAQVEEIEQQIAVEARKVATGLEAQAQVEFATVQSLQDELTRQKMTAGTAATDTVELDELEREAKAQRDLLESYLLRYRDALSRADSGSALPDVRVVTVAAPSVTPASPKVGLILGAVAFVALALQIGGIVFSELMSGRAVMVRSTAAAAAEPEYEEIYEEVLVDEDGNVVSETVVAESGEMIVEAASDEAFHVADDSSLEPGVFDEPEPLSEREPLSASTPVADPAPATTSAPEEPKPAPITVSREPAPAPRHASRGRSALDLSNLSADLALGRAQVVVIASLGQSSEHVPITDRLVADALRNGLAVVRVDAGSGHPSREPGVTDLAAGDVSFGDVVHKGARDGLAEVPWGTQQTIDRRSAKPLTLVGALTDIYEAVIVMTGRMGVASTLPMFAGIESRLVIIGSETAPAEVVEDATAAATALGYREVLFLGAPARQAAVA
jgi:succinoglycan biosynthesis transport protein ExoP